MKLTREKAVATGANRYHGKVCVKHPEQEGKRRTRSAECVECRKERQARWRAAQKKLRLERQQAEQVELLLLKI